MADVAIGTASPTARRPAAAGKATPSASPDPAAWFAARGWKPFAFQREVWAAIAAGRSGLLHATTGAGKTYAVWLGALAAFGADAGANTVLWITPMRALAADTTRALTDAATALVPGWRLGARTGDTGSAERARLDRKPPQALVTTPESLTLLLTRADAREQLGRVRMVVVDEWHELMGNKRGVQVQLALARLARWNPALVVWGLSATLGNLDTARAALLWPLRGREPAPPAQRRPRGRAAEAGAATAAGAPDTPDAPTAIPGVLVQGELPKRLVIDTLIPAQIERFPWGGHLGTRMLEPVVRELDAAATSLVFTNTRSQAEIWYQALLDARPDWAGLIALHHGSLDKEIRDWVELGLKEGRLKAVVCTSSLDLGVDFLPVERVLQIGSPKGVARLLQRAGRSGHAPGRPSRVTLVPTQALELVEAAAAREAALARRVEPRAAPAKPIDVLVQHLVSMALGGGFTPDEMFEEVHSAYSFRELTRAEFDWALGFVEGGGLSLAAYPEYHRIARDDAGIYRVPSAQIARRHRMSVGTIVSDAMISVSWLSGGRIGSIEERFIAFLKPGDAFVFAGRVLELVRVQAMTAYVRKATKSKGVVPQWAGSKMPLSSELADAALQAIARAHAGDLREPELAAVKPLLDLQQRWSALPEPGHLLCETFRSREGHHFLCYPFAGRMVHIGLGSLLAWRAARHRADSFSISMNDYGFELLSAEPFDWRSLIDGGLFSPDGLMDDVLESLNASELARRRFREIARISGLVFTGYPGAPNSARQVQASAGLFYEVFRKHDPANLLLAQAEAEALSQELELDRLRAALERMSALPVVLTAPPRPTPFAFALMVERLRESLSTEKLADRVARMLRELEAAAG
ncbi:ligase-associated DNA damage response DEXH box helicase [Derxia gummosa]|uniref:Ligase-associated DNA damage response DEXH box helicase n=1 Tax=Derxia gummosa DSM 723 TaxID=1121388 RepID=A0A8B6XA89_9BURK|nr:ligase-associated DNA damage response DEXH box helicase [Derxia gummosa]